MLDWVVVTNYGFAVAGLTVAVLGFLMSLYAPHLQVWDRSYFKLFFLVLAAYVSSNLVGTLSVSMLDARFTSLSQACVFCESLFSSALMPLVTIYLLRCAGELSKRSALLRCVAALWTLYLALLILTQYTQYIYYFTPDNVYHRGPLYPVLLVPPILIMCMNLVAFIRRRDRLSRRRQVAFAIVLVLPLTCMLLQMYSYGLLMIVIGTSLASFGLFCFILSDQVQATMAREEEAARQHSALMALQMRPHFIYNVLTSIYYLCAQDPARAQQATLDFTNYLRANFAAVASQEPVPFTEELNHTRAYLAVE